MSNEVFYILVSIWTVAALGFIQHLNLKRFIMSTTQNILDGIALAKQAADDNNAAVLAEIARVEALLATPGGLTQAQIDQANADLAALTAKIQGTTTAAAAERP